MAAEKAVLGITHAELIEKFNELVDEVTTKLLYLTGGELTGALTTKDVTLKGIEQFQTHYAKKLIGALSAGTAYANLDSKYKDGTYHRMWRLRFPTSCNFWGKIKITLYGGYSSFNASGIMSKSITCNFNGSSIYNNVGFYDGLGVNVENDFRISEAIWNSTASAWEILIWQKNLNGNNSPTILLEAWSSSETYLTNAKNITAQAVELTQATTYTASKASSTGGTKTVTWANTPVYETPLGEEIATMSDIPSVPSVSVTQKLTSGTEIGSIKVGSTTTKLYAPTATVTGGDYLPLSGGTLTGRLGFSDGSNERLIIEYDELYTSGELSIVANNGVTIGGATGVSIDGVDGLILNSSRGTATLTSLEAMTLTGQSVYISASEGNLELKSSDNFTLDLSDVATFSGAVYAPYVFVKNTAGGYSDVFSEFVTLAGAIQSVDDKLRDYATQTYVDNSVASLVGGAPETLNALNELAAALGNDPNFATTVSTQIGGKLDKSGGTLTGNVLLSNSNAQGSQPNLKWKTINSKTPYVGYCTGSTDGTFMVASIVGTTYTTGLSIGGSSGNLLWKGTKVATTSDIKTYSVATASTAGLVKPVSVITKPTLNSVTTDSGKYYQVQMSSDGNMFVNVPWTGGSSEKEIVTVDIMTLIQTQDIETFKSLTRRYANGEIILNATMNDQAAIVTGIGNHSETSMDWVVAVPVITYIPNGFLSPIQSASLDVYVLDYTGTSLRIANDKFPLAKAELPEPSTENSGKLIGITDSGYTAVNAPNTKTPYATSSTAAATVAKVATISSNDNNFELAIGQRVLVKFTYANTVASPTLNVNSTGAKTIYTSDYLAITSEKGWTAGDVCEFMYNGTYWIWINSTINAANIQNGTIPAARLPYAAKSTSSSTTAGTKGAVRIRVYNGDLYIHTS